MGKRQPLHKCPDCGTDIGAAKKRCSPCSAERMRKQGLARCRARRRRYSTEEQVANESG